MSLDALLLAYFYVIDPTVQNRQGNDIGTQYQTGVYYTNETAKQTVERIADLERSRSDKFYVEIGPLLNYYAAEVNDIDDNPPIGIILCTDKDSITAEYALGGLSNNIFASRYVLYMPNKEQLIKQVESVLNSWHN